MSSVIGVLEYLSMALGINSMNLLAAVLYMAAFFYWTRKRESEGEPVV